MKINKRIWLVLTSIFVGALPAFVTNSQALLIDSLTKPVNKQ